MRIISLGTSERPVCGVRDYARVLESHWDGVELLPPLWWERSAAPNLGSFVAEAIRQVRGVRRSLGQNPVDVVFWHYSVFGLGYRGVPLVVPLFCAALRKTPSGVVTMLHEFAYPWRGHGLPGKVWAISQRGVLPMVTSTSRGLVVTMDARADWIGKRVWVPQRRILTSPVFATLPGDSGALEESDAARPATTLALFGYAPSDVDVDLVLGVVGRLLGEGRLSRLLLIGSPGAESSIGSRWRSTAEKHGCGAVLSFTGVLSAQEVTEEIGRASLLLLPLKSGPSSRKSTLAKGLMAGKPIIATDGPETWSFLEKERAIRLVRPDVGEVVNAIRALQDDSSARRDLGRRARAFAERHLDPGSEARRILEFVRETCGLTEQTSAGSSVR